MFASWSHYLIRWWAFYKKSISILLQEMKHFKVKMWMLINELEKHEAFQSKNVNAEWVGRRWNVESENLFVGQLLCSQSGNFDFMKNTLIL